MTTSRVNLDQIRKQYPQYKNWSDTRLMNAIQRKQAAESAQENEPVDNEGVSGVANDVIQS